jgi:hypothetical protein
VAPRHGRERQRGAEEMGRRRLGQRGARAAQPRKSSSGDAVLSEERSGGAGRNESDRAALCSEAQERRAAQDSGGRHRRDLQTTEGAVARAAWKQAQKGGR